MTPPDPRVTIVLPVWNGARFVEQALASVAAQSFDDYEVIVVDDGSVDATAELARAAERDDGRVRYLYQRHAGLAAARNTGIRAARGDLIALLDVDDLFLPAKLERQVAALDRQPELGFAYSNFHLESLATGDRSGSEPYLRRPTGAILPELLERNFIQSPTVLVRRAVFERCGPFDESQVAVEDYDMWLRMAAAFDGVHLPEPLAVVRLHDDNMSRDRRTMHRMEIAALRKLREREPRFAAEHTARLRRRLGRLHYELGYAHMLAGDTAAARRAFATSLRALPGEPRSWLYGACCLLGPRAVASLRRLRGRTVQVGRP